MGRKKKQDKSLAQPDYEFSMRGKPGYSVRHNPKSKFQVHSMWFWADPEKRSLSWMEKEFAGLDKLTIEREYFGERILYGGKAVYEGAFHPEIHIAAKPLDADPRFPLVRGWDFAHNHAVVVGQFVGPKLRILAEFPNLGYNTRIIAPKVLSECAQLFPQNPVYIEVVDPAGVADGKSATGVSCVDVLQKEHGLTVRMGLINPPQRIDSVVKLLCTLGPDGKSLFEISPSCRMSIDAFKGAYHYPEKQTQSQRADRPVKNHPYSDLMDCIQYVAGMNRGQPKVEVRRQFDEEHYGYRFGK